LGAAAGDERVQRLARDANRHLPELRSHDAQGNRVDEVEFHPAYHELMALAFGSGVHSLAWTADEPGGHTARGVLSYLWNQIENGVGCPVGMTYSAPPILALDQELDALWREGIMAEAYEPELKPIHEKSAASIGMTLTEKQGGSDLRANQTRAEPAREIGANVYRLTGHKWFCSAPMSDAFVTLAQTQAGPTCFLLPRVLPDGERNPFQIQRLKDKCGNRSNASAEVEFPGTLVWRLGEEGRGIAAALSMTHLTRADFAIASAGLMRQALMLALHHCRHRRVFQKSLVDQPLMGQVLADLAIESEAAMWLGLRLAHAIDRMDDDEAERHLVRVMTPMAKFWICKRATPFLAEALECIGGNGFVEEHAMARLYREAPLNGIWEGAGNVVALDVLRALGRTPQVGDALIAEIRQAQGQNAILDQAIADLETQLARDTQPEAHCRQLVGAMAQTLQASLLARFAPAHVLDAFCAARLGAGRGPAFGAGPEIPQPHQILQRAAPNFSG
jgi:putative acyl-CoA dehydrogenase